jgi:hypothetical protein
MRTLHVVTIANGSRTSHLHPAPAEWHAPVDPGNDTRGALAGEADASEHTKRRIATRIVARVNSVSPGNRTNRLPTASVNHLTLP